MGNWMPQSHWENYHRLWDRLGPPLRPHQDVVAAIETLLADHAKHVLLLGVTPEFADLGARLTAIDHSEQMIANVWPGDTQDRHAERGDWLALPFPEHHFSCRDRRWKPGNAGLSCCLQQIIRPIGARDRPGRSIRNALFCHALAQSGDDCDTESARSCAPSGFV